jgi:hypothetical protein
MIFLPKSKQAKHDRLKVLREMQDRTETSILEERLIELDLAEQERLVKHNAKQPHRPGNDFQSVLALLTKNQIVRYDLLKWRIVEPTIGELNGLSKSHGVLVATNGIDVLIERSNQGPYVGPDLAHFLVDQNATEKVKKVSKKSTTKTKEVKSSFD